jgi:hypothetical protein
MKCALTVSILAAVLALPRSRLGAQVYYQGAYTLALIDSAQVPHFLPGLVQGEGSALTDMTIELLPHRRCQGRVILVYTDSGTVTDTITVKGSWIVRRYQLTLDYTLTHARWRTHKRERVVGHIGKSGLTLPEFAGFGPRYFGRSVTLAFRRN